MLFFKKRNSWNYNFFITIFKCFWVTRNNLEVASLVDLLFVGCFKGQQLLSEKGF